MQIYIPASTIKEIKAENYNKYSTFNILYIFACYVHSVRVCDFKFPINA